MIRGLLKLLFGLVVFLLAAAAAFAALFYQPDIPRAELEARYASPPSRFETLPDGTRVHLRDQGQATGRPILLLHGSNASLFTWEPLAAILGRTRRVVTIDLPGHGLTGATPRGDYSQAAMAETALAVADRLSIERFTIGGNSMGGGVAARVAAMAPERVEALILLDAGGVPPVAPRERPWFFQLPTMPVIKDALRWVTPKFIFESGLRNAFHDPSLVTPAMVDLYYGFAVMAGSREATFKRFSTPSDGWLAANLGRIAAPTLILWGRDDRITRFEDFAPVFQKGIPHAETVVIEKAGHVPMEEKPAETAAAIEAFLAKAGAGG